MNRIIENVNVKDDEAQTLAYADDVAVVSKTVTQLQEILSMLNDELRNSSKKISKRKTEVMMVSRQ